jgi:lipoprotein-anchoring transpeptidase ErfK/SrfK
MPRREMSNWDKIVSFFKPRSGLMRWAIIVVVGVLVFFVLASSVLVYADSRHRGEMFPNTVVLGVDITGMTREDAMALITEQAVKPLKTPLTLEFRGQKWILDPNELGLNIDVEALVDQAYSSGWDTSIVERVWRRAFNQPKNIDVGLDFSLSREAVLQKLSSIAAEINCDVENAYLDFNYSTGALKFHPSQDGLWLDIDATLAAVTDALPSENRVLQPTVAVTPPSVSSDDVQAVIVVNVMGNSLKLYSKDTLVRTYDVATGLPKYPTPLGKFYIIRKEANPVWLNPNVEWSKDMPPRIEPGPSNPLGVRALVTSASGGTVLIHGTANLTPGLYSHGCIRMANWAVMEVFDSTNVGTPVFIWTSSPVPAPPPEEGPPTGPEDPGLGSGQGQTTTPQQDSTQTQNPSPGN